jgi:hypothetical protein
MKMELSEITPKMRVKVTIEGTVLAAVNDDIRIVSYDGIVRDIEYSGSTIFTVAEPEGWGPELGDVWEADSKDYYVVSSLSNSMTITPFDNGMGYCSYYRSDNPKEYPNSFDAFLKLNPKLVRRRSK